jgi:hypothetical protein
MTYIGLNLMWLLREETRRRNMDIYMQIRYSILIGKAGK